MTKSTVITVKDDKGRLGKITANFDDSATNADVQSWITAFVRSLDPVIYGACVSVTLTQKMALPSDIRQIADVRSDVEERLITSFKAGAYKTSVTFPTFNDEFTAVLISTKERIPDFLQPELDAVFNLWTSADLLGHPQPTDARGVPITDIFKSRYKHKRG